MHVIASRVFRTVCRLPSRQACRFIAGSRYPVLRRSFHRSAVSYQAPDETPSTDNDDRLNHENSTALDHSSSKIPADAAKADTRLPQHVEQSEIESRTNPTDGEDLGKEDGDALEDAEPLKVGAKARRSPLRKRQQQPQGLPPLVVPQWFVEKNVRCFQESGSPENLAVESAQDVDLENTEEICDVDEARKIAQLNHSLKVSDRIQECGLPATKNARYSLHVDVYLEILSTIRAGLTLRPHASYADKKHIPRPVTVLQCPKDGGSHFLDAVLETVAHKVEADLVSIDAQDIAQIVGPYLDENHAWTPSSTALLGYTTQKMAGKLEVFEHDSAETDDLESGDEMEISRPPRSRANHHALGRAIFRIITAAPPNFSVLPNPNRPLTDRIPSPFRIFSSEGNGSPPKPSASQWADLKAAAILEAIVNSADNKRAGLKDSLTSRRLIVNVKDYKEIRAVENGAEILNKLRSIIDKRWSEGRDVILVGTTSTDEEGSVLSKSDIQSVQTDTMEGERKTIIVPPNHGEDQLSLFEVDEKARIRRINVRHIEDMIRQLAYGNEPASLIIDIEHDLNNAVVYSAGLEDAVLMYATVHRIATAILGVENPSNIVNGPIFTKALDLLSGSDQAKFTWSSKEIKQEDLDLEALQKSQTDAPPVLSKSTKLSSERLKRIKRNATTHEAKLLGGVITPSDINTTFSNVHAPKETVEALKTLTSLSLTRPDAFSYGVLATDKIPGLLLYGPPGTGKTLLAKAVAKESGATVLEVSGADVNDMYVGESEKNVKAIFSLAKKLSPCVVFIDEADAIFAARGGESKRNAVHREMINQFLREWDGMNDLSAFIMVATNRPFDLDEAVLRRLPRRLLVDLPVEKDREAILRIHLSGEALDKCVCLARIAKDTPFYSGSDLKNLSVAAAMACIREENEEALKYVGQEPYKYPEKRILTMQHFSKAMEEISASISDDMSTLSAIRKFDEKYGDRKGRRKKRPAMGFGGTTEPEKDSESGRVRKIEA